MTEEAARLLCVFALLTAGLLGSWAAWACRRASQQGRPGADALVWAGLALVFLAFAQTKIARDLGWLDGWGTWFRTLAKHYDFYSDRRPFQILASVSVAVIAAIIFLYGLIWIWDAIKRYRLAIGFAAMAVGFATIRFISLHEVDAWIVAFPWVKTAVEVVAAAGASAIALSRLRQLGEFARFRPPD